MSTRDVTHLIDLGKMNATQDGSFNRKPSQFTHWIEQGGKYEPETGRYHLYVSYGCPWATRTLIMRQLKGLEDMISVTVVSPRTDSQGWPFANVDPFPGAEVDPLYGVDHIKDLYLRASPEYEGRFTVPVLYDTKTESIVNNESSEIIRMFNSAFNHLLPTEKAELDFYPEGDRRAERVGVRYHGVYKAGFAVTQSAYEKAVHPLFESLDRLERIVDGKDYLVGDQLTEADIRLFVTIIRFDVAYHGRFRCNIRSIRHGYPSLHLWLRKLYWNIPAFKDNTKFDHIKYVYYWPQFYNPQQIVPVGPLPNILPLEA